MKVITTNLLNRFWKNGVKPIKEAVTGKLDASKVVNSLLATEEGFALDATQGKALKDQVDELNRKLDQESSTKVMGFSFLRRGNEVLMTHNSILEVVEAGHVYTNQGSIPMGYRPVLDLSAIPGLITDGNNKIRGTWWLVANSTGSINVISSITHSDPLSYVTSASWPTSDVINL